MEILESLVSKYGYALCTIAALCYSIITALRRVSVLEQSPMFKAWLPMLPVALGGLLGACLPWIFAEGEATAMRAVIGVIAGSNAANLVAFGRRALRLMVAKKTDEATAAALLAPIDESGASLPADGSVDAGNIDKKPTPE